MFTAGKDNLTAACCVQEVVTFGEEDATLQADRKDIRQAKNRQIQSDNVPGGPVLVCLAYAESCPDECLGS